jgi:hypothetical protein
MKNKPEHVESHIRRMCEREMHRPYIPAVALSEAGKRRKSAKLCPFVQRVKPKPPSFFISRCVDVRKNPKIMSAYSVAEM